MKYLASLLLVIISINLFAQIEIKDVVLGEKLKVEEERIVTLGGIRMGNVNQTLNDGRVSRILFMPCNENMTEIERVHTSDVETIKKGLISKYGLTFQKYEEEYTDDYYLRAEKDEVIFLIDVKYNQFYDKPVQMSVVITSISLNAEFEAEEQEKANKDF